MTAYSAGLLEGLQPDPAFTVSEWADEHRLLSSKASAEPGRWRTDRTPYLREIMDALSVYDPTQRVVFMKSAQIGGTEAGNNWIGYVMHHAPGPMLYVLPTVEIAEKASKQRIAPMLEESPALRELVAPARSRDSGNTLLSKEFRGGVFMMTGANSAAGLRSMPIKWLFMDEVDAYPSDVEGEGSPIALAENRTITFSRRKVLLVSTPTEAGTSRIEIEYQRSDQRRYFVPCPHCGHMQWLRWRGFGPDDSPEAAKTYRLIWTDEKRTAAAYLCGECGAHIEERHKTGMLAAGQWQATAPGDGVTAGYHINSLYSPAGWKSWVEILREFEDASKDPALLKTFVNTTLGEPFEAGTVVRLDAEGLSRRAGPYRLGDPVPQAGVLLTAGIDMQRRNGGYAQIIVRAWGSGDESWLVDRKMIYGDANSPRFWDQVTDALDQTYEHESGATVKIRATAIDSGDGETTHLIYAYARANRGRHVLATKGMSTPGKPLLGKPSLQDVNILRQTVKRGVELWPIGSDTGKSLIHSRLKIEDFNGAGVMHWPLGLDPDYWTQLTSERQVVKIVNGFPRRHWVKKDSDKNEDLDCEVLAAAALEYVKTRHNRATMYSQMAEALRVAAQTADPAPVVAIAPKPAPPSQPRRPAAPVNRPRSW